MENYNKALTYLGLDYAEYINNNDFENSVNTLISMDRDDKFNVTYAGYFAYYNISGLSLQVAEFLATLLYCNSSEELIYNTTGFIGEEY